MPLIRALTLLLVCLTPPSLTAQDVPFDIVIRNGHIIDGTGSPWPLEPSSRAKRGTYSPGVRTRLEKVPRSARDDEHPGKLSSP